MRNKKINYEDARRIILKNAGFTEGEDGELYEELRKLRRDVAIEREVPSYIIFSNETLRVLALAKPTTLEEFAAIQGVGEFKLAEYGTCFIELISNYLSKYKVKEIEAKTE